MKSYFIENLKSTIYIYKVLGIVCFSNDDKENLCKDLLWCLPFCGVYMYCSYNGIYSFWQIHFLNNNNVVQIGDFILVNISICNVITRIVYNIRNGKTVREILQQVDGTNKITPKNYLNISKQFFILMITEILQLFASSLTFVKHAGINGLPTYFTYSLNNCISFIENYFIYKLIDHITDCMKIINRNTIKYYNDTPSSIKQKSRVTAVSLLNTTKIHYQLINLARLLNASYGIPIALNILSNFVIFISSAHYLTSLLVFFDNKNAVTYYDYLLFNVIWCISAISQISIIIITWTSFSREVSLIIIP